MTAGPVYYASTERPGRTSRSLQAAVQWFQRFGEVQKLELPATHPGPGDHFGLPDAFNETPAALIESWRVAQRIDAVTEPGASIVISDRDGISGVLALEQAMRANELRRKVIVLAGESTYLRYKSHAGTVGGLSGDLASALDWELTGYRWADVVVTPSGWVADELGKIGVVARLIDIEVGVPAPVLGSYRRIWIPEPVVRQSRVGSILRAINTAESTGPDIEVVISDVDGEDEVWTGTTWDALDGLRLVHHAKLIRGPVCDDPDLVILGDRTAMPDESTRKLVRSGVLAFVPSGSTASALWPSMPTWGDTTELASLLGSAEGKSSTTSVAASADRSPMKLELGSRPSNRERAKRISVGIPVFRDVRFLSECVESILNQSESPYEVLIYDDGSNLDSVDVALQSLEDQYERVRVLSGPNQGVCVARNEMLEVMGGDAFIFVDADDLLESTFLRQTAEALRANPHLGAVATWTRFFGTYEAVEAKPPFDRRTGLNENPIISTCALIDMDIREKGIRFVPDLAWLFCEDWQFWSQIVASGGEFGLVPEPLAKHRVHSSGGHRRTDLAYSMGRARATELLR